MTKYDIFSIQLGVLGQTICQLSYYHFDEYDISLLVIFVHSVSLFCIVLREYRDYGAFVEFYVSLEVLVIFGC